MPKQKNDSFYTLTRASNTKCGRYPTGQPHVPNLVSGLPYWKEPLGDFIRTKKTLILPQHIFDNVLVNNKKIIMLERLFALHDQGFKMYLFKDNIFLPFQTKVKVFCHKIGFFMSPLLQACNRTPFNNSTTNDKAIYKKAAHELQLNPDAILLLTPERIQKLLAGDDEDWKSLPSKKHCDLRNSNISMPSLKRLLQQYGKTMETLDLRGCLNLGGETGLEGNLPSSLKTLALGEGCLSKPRRIRREKLP